MKVRKRLAAGITAAVVLVGLGGGVAFAALNVFGSGSMTQHIVRTENAASFYSGNAYQTFAVQSVGVPGGTTRLITSRFTSESLCAGNAGSYCSIRILIRNNATGALVEMFPRASTDFAFDSVSSDNWESNSVERTIRVGAGSYSVWLQRAVVGTATFRLDDWTFTVDSNT